MVVLVILVVGGPFVFIHFIEGKAPAKLTLSAATGQAGSSAGTVPLDGEWSVTKGSVVGYRVKEVLFGQDNTAVGRTSDVTGSITISATSVTAGTFTVRWPPSRATSASETLSSRAGSWTSPPTRQPRSCCPSRSV